MRIAPRTKYDATRIARTLVNGLVEFTFECHDGNFEFTIAPHWNDQMVIHLFRNMDDLGSFICTDPLTAEQVRRMCNTLDSTKEASHET
jgi:hypothetical protein